MVQTKGLARKIPRDLSAERANCESQANVEWIPVQLGSELGDR